MTFETLLERLKLGIVCAAVVTLFHYWGGFHLQAALLLGVAFTVVAIWLYALYEIAAFKPYRLIIGIRYEALWEDLRLSPVDGSKFENFIFTAIGSAVFARSDERNYSAKLDIYRVIPCARPAWNPGFGELENCPTFFLRPYRDGYQFGVHVQKEWWSKQVNCLDSSLTQRPLAYDGTIALGYLPSGYFPDHIRRWDASVSLIYPFDYKQRKWKRKLNKDGWQLDDNDPERIEHRYLVIQFRSV